MMADDGVPDPDRGVLLTAARSVLHAIKSLGLTDDQAAEVLAGFMAGAWQDGWCSHRATAAVIQRLKRRQPH
jgi:hypothetical protein